MIGIRRTRLLALALTACLAASGCSSIGSLNPFNRGKSDREKAGEGQRITIIGFDDRLEPSDALKGQDFLLPEPQGPAEWPLPGGSPEQAVGHADAAPNLSVAWRRSFGRGSGRGSHVTAPPIVAAGKVFVMDGEASVSAFDARTGSELWRTSVKPREGRRDKEAFGGGVAYADGKLYVSSGYRVVVQLDAATGSLGWSTRTEQPIHAAPTVAGGRVIVVALHNTLLTFDTANGAPGWNYQALTEPARILAASSPAVSGDMVVASFSSGELVALRTSNGTDLWSEALSRASRTNALSEIRDIPGRPVIYQGDVFAVSHSGIFAATDLRSGQARWTQPVTGMGTPWPAGDVVYVVSKAGQVICVSRENGQIYWIRDLNAGQKGKKTGGFLGLGGKRVIKPFWSGPLLVNSRLLVGGTTGDLAVLNAKTGDVLRTINLGGGMLISPIAAGGMVYVVTDDAKLVALR
jgi:outer membrane protein assembly factor BamB